MKDKIFISIASFRDPLLMYTIVRCWDNAVYKKNLVFSVVDQSFPQEKLDLSQPCFDGFRDQIHYQHYHPHESKGCCWARALAQKPFNDEKYYCQIDSHTGWETEWDLKFISAIEHLQQWHEKPLITGYPDPMSAIDDDIINHPLPVSHVPVCATPIPGKYNIRALCCGSGDTTFHEDGTVNYRGLIVDKFEDIPEHWKHYYICRSFQQEQPYIHGFAFSANTVFTLGSFVREVPYDEKLFFHGEEPSLAIRAWTNGYNIFHMYDYPTRHYYGRSYRDGLMFWDEGTQAGHKDKWWDLDELSHKRQTLIFTDELDDIYGLGRARTLDQYISISGVDYKNKKIDPRCFTKELPLFHKNYKEQPI
jgi:hypothetical protein